MSDVKRIGSIEIDQDLAAQAREWKFSRAAWATFSLLLVAAFAGAFGDGPLAHASAKSDGLRVEYERFARALAPSRLRIHVRADSTGVVAVRFERAYLEQLELGEMRPQPESAEPAGDWVVYRFRVAPEASPESAADAGEHCIELRFQHRACGRLAGRIGLVDGAEARLSHLVYP
jgi:hypothetical protein